MARWSDVERAEPELAARARGFFDAHKHKTLATLRADGSPRISGTECEIAGGDLWFGSMPGARKARDLQRDGRFALHSGSEDPPEWEGDAKVSGRAEEVSDPATWQRYLDGVEGGQQPGTFHLFRAEISELTVVRLNEERTRLVIEHWSEDGGLKVIERA